MDDLQWLNNSIRFANCDRYEGYLCYSLYDYYPQQYSNISEKSTIERELIWDFKNGSYNERLPYDIANVIINEKILRSNSVFAIIPASTAVKTYHRYFHFCHTISTALGITNGYNWIDVINDRDPAHNGEGMRGDVSNLKFSKNFKWKHVILFDDIITTGHSFIATVSSLKSVGVIGGVTGIFLGKTQSIANVKDHSIISYLPTLPNGRYTIRVIGDLSDALKKPRLRPDGTQFLTWDAIIQSEGSPQRSILVTMYDMV